MSLLLEALRHEVEESQAQMKNVNAGRDSEYPDYSDQITHSDSGGWSDNWNDGPNHSDSWSDSGWPLKR